MIGSSKYLFSISKLPPCSFAPPPYSGPSYESVKQNRSKYLPKFYAHYYKDPLLLNAGHMQYLYDHKGERYLDLICGISTVAVGHSHPEITQVITEQSKRLIHTSTIFMNQFQGQYAKHLSQALGPGYENVYLCNSGSQANDFAIQLARIYKKQQKVMCLRHAYHGVVGNAALATSIYTWTTSAIRGVELDRFAWPSTYRGAHKTIEGLLADAREVITSNTNGKIAGFIFEPIQGVGGINPLPQGYLPEMVKLVKEHDGITICDQVQTGFGRVGKDFWGHRWQNIKPDIVTMAKGIGNGLPLAAVATRRQIAQSINFSFFNTFGGGAIQSRVGMKVLEIIKRDKLHQNAQNVGNYLMTELKKLQAKHKYIGDVRGKGLMIGIQIVKNKETKEPSKDQIAQLMEQTRKRQLLFGKGGVFGNVLRIQPSFVLTMEDAKYTIEALDDALHAVK